MYCFCFFLTGTQLFAGDPEDRPIKDRIEKSFPGCIKNSDRPIVRPDCAKIEYPSSVEISYNPDYSWVPNYQRWEEKSKKRGIVPFGVVCDKYENKLLNKEKKQKKNKYDECKALEKWERKFKKRKKNFLAEKKDLDQSRSNLTEYITEVFTQDIVQSALLSIKEGSDYGNLNFSHLDIDYGQGEDSFNPLLMAPDQTNRRGKEDEWSAHARLKLINKHKVKMYIEISFMDGYVAIMPYWVYENDDALYAWYLIGNWYSEGKTFIVKPLVGKDSDIISAMKAEKSRFVSDMKRYLYAELQVLSNININQIESHVKSWYSLIPDPIMIDKVDTSNMPCIKKKAYLIGRWDDFLSVDDRYISYPFETQIYDSEDMKKEPIPYPF